MSEEPTLTRAQRTRSVPPDWRTRATVTVPQYAQIMDVGINTAYRAVHAGEVATVKLQGRILVSVPALLRQLEAA